MTAPAPLTRQSGKHPRDPMFWCIAIPAIFAALASIRLSIPNAPLFDEVHYLPAAREFLSQWAGDGGIYRNREHPLLGKQLIAVGMAWLGDNPLGWRIMPLIAGAVTLSAGMRALWHASHDRFATIAFGILASTGFNLLVQARIAMLDIFMAAFLALALLQFAAAVREPETGRRRLALCGVFIGCALASKWNAVPIAMAFGIAFLAVRLCAHRRHPLTSRRGAPVPGISLVEAAWWLGIVPLVVYALTFVPGYALGNAAFPPPLAEQGLIGLHAEMIALQRQVIEPHTYQSGWAQWMWNTRGIWFLYEYADGAQRGVLLVGNPLTMIIGLPALIWCVWSKTRDRDWAKLGAAGGYAISIGLWIVAPKPVKFYYHYLVPSLFLLAALSLCLSDIRTANRGWIAYAILAASGVLFAYFLPILTAAPLDDPDAFLRWAWIPGWR